MYDRRGVGRAEGLGGEGLVREGRSGRGGGPGHPAFEDQPAFGGRQDVQFTQGQFGMGDGLGQQSPQTLRQALGGATAEEVGGELQEAVESAPRGHQVQEDVVLGRTRVEVQPLGGHARQFQSRGRGVVQPDDHLEEGKRLGERSTSSSRTRCE